MSSPALSLSDLPDLVLLRLAEFLKEEDTVRLGMTCRRLRHLLPKFLVMRGNDFSVGGSGTGWGDVEPYFDGHRLPAGVKRLTVSVAGWNDQGWGNRKGELFVRLMRSVEGEEKRSWWPHKRAPRVETQVAERRDFFGLAEHRETNARLGMDDGESVVASARSGDWYRFMRRVGGGGGHELIVRGFRAVAMLDN